MLVRCLSKVFACNGACSTDVFWTFSTDCWAIHISLCICTGSCKVLELCSLGSPGLTCSFRLLKFLVFGTMMSGYSIEVYFNLRILGPDCWNFAVVKTIYYLQYTANKGIGYTSIVSWLSPFHTKRSFSCPLTYTFGWSVLILNIGLLSLVTSFSHFSCVGKWENWTIYLLFRMVV